jgi:opacity protein-like surface antigen
MKIRNSLVLFSFLMAGAAAADGLYYVGTEAQESLPLKWVVGVNAIYDDNTTPGFIGSDGEESVSINPYAGLSFVNISPQTTLDVYVRLGLIYYFDAPDTQNDDLYPQARAGVNYTHRFNERLRFASRSFIAYELEPDYSYGFATTRLLDEYFFWQTDNSVGFRWSERFATYTGFMLEGLNYSDVPNADRFTWTVYNQLRYQLNPQTVLTGEYRYAETDAQGAASDVTNHYVLVGAEHRFSPTTILVTRLGAQFHRVDDGDNATSPYLEMAFSSQMTEQFRVRGFARYGIESYDTVHFQQGLGLIEYDERQTLRLGISGEYAVSQMLSLFGGVDYIPSSFRSGRLIATGDSVGGVDEDIFNTYVGVSMKFTDNLFGTLSYNYTNSSSDLTGRDYDRNRVSVGVRAEF